MGSVLSHQGEVLLGDIAHGFGVWDGALCSHREARRFGKGLSEEDGQDLSGQDLRQERGDGVPDLPLRLVSKSAH